MTLNYRRVLTGLAVTGVLGGALAGGGVALASTGSTPSSTAATAATATASPAPAASGRCDGGVGMGGPGGLPGPGGLGFGWDGQSVTKAVANYLGITQNKLRTQLESGKSLAQVATADGKSVSGLENALVAAITTRINAASGLTAAQKTKLISELKSHIDGLVNSTRPSAVGMRPPMGWPAMMGGGGPAM